MPAQTPQRQRSRHDEEMTARAVIAHLLSEGRGVSDLRRPTEGSGRSPDFLVTIGGRDVSIEVVRYLPPAAVQKALARIRSVDSALGRLLDDDAHRLGANLLLDVTFRVAPLQEHGRADVARDAMVLAADIRAALHLLSTSASKEAAVATEVGWVLAAHIAVVPSLEPHFLIGATGPEPAFSYVEAPDFVRRTLMSKSKQHLGYSDRPILAIRSMFDDAKDLREAFAFSNEAIPWWRVYDVWGGGDVRLVFENATMEDLESSHARS